MSDQEQLLKWLQFAQLESFYPNFMRRKVTCESFLMFTMQDYGLVGISSFEDRKKLFHLLQQLKKNGGVLSNTTSPVMNSSPPATIVQQTQPVQQPVQQTRPISKQQPIDPVQQAQELLRKRVEAANADQQQFYGGGINGGSPVSKPSSSEFLKDFDIRNNSLNDFLDDDFIDPSTPPSNRKQQPIYQQQNQFNDDDQEYEIEEEEVEEEEEFIEEEEPDFEYDDEDDVIDDEEGDGYVMERSDDEEEIIVEDEEFIDDEYIPSESRVSFMPTQQSFTQMQPPAQIYNQPTVNSTLNSSRTIPTSVQKQQSVPQIQPQPQPQQQQQPAPVQQPAQSDFSLDMSEYGQRIRVCVRKRPLNKKEIGRNEKDILENNGKKELLVHEPKVKLDMTKYTEKHKFIFDEVFDENSNNYQVYLHTAYPLVDSIFHKGKATCFAYGQTGSGKTFTMIGNGDGLYALAARDIFHRLNTYFADQLQVYVSFFEIYGGKLFDLLHNRKKLECRENEEKNVVISGLGERYVTNAQELMNSVDDGNKIRSTGSTGVNADSSRSHAILQVSLKNIKTQKLHGKFSFIDLAGSERGSDTYDNDKQTRKEGADINKSLLALKECIRALDQSSKHTPFRQSTLTQVLKDSFVGNSRTVMIANVSPNHASSEHTLNTLRYADRVKELGNSDSQVKKIVQTYSIPAPLPPPDNILAKMTISSPPTESGSSNSSISNSSNSVTSNNSMNNSSNGVNNDYDIVVPTPQPVVQQSKPKSQQQQPSIQQSSIQQPSPINIQPQSSSIQQPSPVTHQMLQNITSVPKANPKFDYVNHHRDHLDQLADILKKELTAIAHFENRNMTIDTYLSTIDQFLNYKQQLINNLRTVIQQQQQQQQMLQTQFQTPLSVSQTTTQQQPTQQPTQQQQQQTQSGLRERARSLIQPPKQYSRS